MRDSRPETRCLPTRARRPAGRGRGLALFALLLAVASTLTGCPTEPPTPPVDPVFPSDYASTYEQVYDCRRSVDHDLAYVRVWASPEAAEVYAAREGTLADGSILLKETFADESCTDLMGWTVMRREEGFAPTTGDWHWQDVAFDRTVMEDGNLPDCTDCHSGCESPPDGFDWTCTQP